ncbi:MAG TPA: hypothetical protein ENF57_00600 [Candidatus Korarchaeota archaeon]|nr:hypothetical protein [Candidatus Korarchaeota archaeon]
MRKVSSYALIALGTFLLLLGILSPFRAGTEKAMVVEGGTFEIVHCNTSSTLTLNSNGSLCIDFREISMRPLSEGRSIKAKNIRFPAVKGGKGNLSLRIENYDASLDLHYRLVDGGLIIPVNRGLWNVSLRSEEPSMLYEVERDLMKDGRIFKEGDEVRIFCGNFSVLLYNPSSSPIVARVMTNEGEGSLALITMGVAITLSGLALRRYCNAQGSWRGKSGDSSSSPSQQVW